MTDHPFLDRQLTYLVDSDRVNIAHSRLHELSENLVILGEAGMGKSRLLAELAVDGCKFVSARRLIGAADPKSLVGNATTVLIDALDEAPSFKEGDAVDRVFMALERAGYPHFVLSCRVEDWQGATGTSMIREHYGTPPLELYLTPLDRPQIEQFFAHSVGADKATSAYAYYEERQLEEWLGNPQTLEMVERVAREGKFPETSSKLFEQFIDLCWRDSNDIKREANKSLPTKETVLDILGSAFAQLILTGSRALVLAAASEIATSEYSVDNLESFPGVTSWADAAGNRLIRTIPGEDKRFTYLHRRIGEYLGAQWLSKYANTTVKRERLLNRLSKNGIVPASLRGIFGWLSLDSHLAKHIITTDPMAVVEYADADCFDEEYGRILLEALGQLARDNPWFRDWKTHRAKALVRGNLLHQSMRIISTDESPFHLRMTLLEQLQGENYDNEIIDQLKTIAIDTAQYFALRQAACKALGDRIDVSEWSFLVEEFRQQATRDSMRLASETIIQVGVEHFDSQQIIETIFAHGGFSLCRAPAEEEDSLGLRFYQYRTAIPDDRLESTLDLLSEFCNALMPEHRDIECGDIISLSKALIVRQLKLGTVEPKRLWKWISAVGDRHGYADEDNKALSGFLHNDVELRRAIQQLVILAEADASEMRLAAYKMGDIERALHVNDDDLAYLLDAMPDGDCRWQEILLLINHTDDQGVAAREAATRHAKKEEGGEKWLAGLTKRPKPKWQIEQEERARKRAMERNTRWEESRARVREHVEDLRLGRFSKVVGPAQAYLARFSDIDQKLPPAERLADWLGDELQQAAFEGFRNYLNILPPYPAAAHIAESYTESKSWSAMYILLAALAERVRAEESLDKITDDQLVSAQLHISNHWVSEEEFKPLRNAVQRELIRRPAAYANFAHLAIEPSLKKRSEHISGLHEIISEPWDKSLAIELALEWLNKYPRMHGRPEEAMIDLLLKEAKFNELLTVCLRRLKSKVLTEERQRNWLAVLLLVDFSKGKKRLDGISKRDRDMLWTIRARLGGRRMDAVTDNVATEIAAWIVNEFRETFPITNRPSGVTSGDVNPWDASDYLSRLIDRVGSDISDEAKSAIDFLAKTNDGYRDRILSVKAEQKRKRAEQQFVLFEKTEVAAILTDSEPESLPDLQTRLLQLLDLVEAQVRSNDTESWRGFYDGNNIPVEEEQCSERLIDILRAHEQNITFTPEGHIGHDREIDIDCTLGNLRLPIELKGQWHAKLWTAADDQLDQQQAVDHRAQGYGIYLVLWFGDVDRSGWKPLTGAPRGSGITKPQTPLELESALIANSQAVKNDRITIKVIDLTHDFD